MSIVERERVETEVVTPPVTTKDVLHRAADLLEEFGWQQGDYGSKLEGKMCLRGAVQEAVHDLGLAPDTVIDLLYGGEIFSYSELSPMEWNDTPGRTKAEVVTRLRDAAESL